LLYLCCLFFIFCTINQTHKLIPSSTYQGDIAIPEEIIAQLPSGYFRVSVVNKEGIDKVRSLVRDMLVHDLPKILHLGSEDDIDI
jgi:hypothetical protein